MPNTCRYLGNCSPMLETRMCKPKAVRGYLTEQQQMLALVLYGPLLGPILLSDGLGACMLEQLKSRKHLTIDHIIPSSQGGRDDLFNYFLMPSAANNYFGNDWSCEKVAYIGVRAAVMAGALQGLELSPGHPALRMCSSMVPGKKLQKCFKDVNTVTKIS